MQERKKLKTEKGSPSGLEGLGATHPQKISSVASKIKVFPENPINNIGDKSLKNGSKEYNDYSSYVQSLRQQTFRFWKDNPYISAQKLCRELKISHKKHGQTIRNYLSQFRCNYNFGSLQGSHNFAVRHRRVFEILEAVVLSEDREKSALVCGWKVTSNKNRMLFFNGRNGSVVWYRNGLVLIYLQGMAPLARVKKLFWEAFSFLGDKECIRLSDLIKPRNRHNVFELGEKVPRFDIRYFEASHGLRIKSDGTHPTAIEVEESEPLYLAKYDHILEKFGEEVGKFGKEIDAHLDLITAWKNEAEAARIKRIEAAVQSRRQDNFLLRIGAWLNKDVSLLSKRERSCS